MEKFNFTPENGFKSSSAYYDPQTESQVREQLFRPHEQTRDFINSMVDHINGNDTAISRLNGKVDAVGGGQPIPVNHIADMTDTSTIYLYTGTESGYASGHWYYYNGSAWVDSGMYGSGSAVYVDGKTLVFQNDITSLIADGEEY